MYIDSKVTRIIDKTERTYELARFDSPEQAIGWATTNSMWKHSKRSSEWNRNINTLEGFQNLLTFGDKELEQRTLKAWNKLHVDNVPQNAPKWALDVAGCIPSVPAYLAGDPRCMRRKMLVKQPLPARIFASVCVSGGVPASLMEQRGVIVAALVYKLAAIRPVELWVTSETRTEDKSKFHMIRLNTKPLNLSRICAMLAHPAALRTLFFSLSDRRNSHSIQWAFGRLPFDKGTPEVWSAAMGVDLSRDVYIPGTHLDDPLLEDPKAWIQREFDRINGKGK